VTIAGVAVIVLRRPRLVPPPAVAPPQPQAGTRDA
jgi:hypothetical protein